MKKLIAIIMIMVLTASVSTTAFAAEDLSAGSGESEIKAHVYSSYNITIPAVIDLTNGDVGYVEISNAMLEDNYSVNVYISNTEDFGGIRLIHESGSESIHCTFTNIETNMLANNQNPLVSFGKSDIQESHAIKDFEINADTFGLPGNYSGIMQYSFECQPNT